MTGSSAGEPGELVPHPAGSGMRSLNFIVDENKRGTASEMKIVGILWGRLVDVYDSSGALQQQDLVIGEDIRTNQFYQLSTNPVTEKTQVVINAEAGTATFVSALLALDANLTPVQEKSLDPGELPPFSMMPRNAALVVRFDDLLDPRFENGQWHDSYDGNLISPNAGQLNAQVVKLLSDYPPDQPFEARIILDPNHGDLAAYGGGGVQTFHSTRVIIDSTVSEVDASGADNTLPVNSLGLPASITTQEPNMVVRIPTRQDASVGQNLILTNPTLHGLAFFSNGPNDSSSSTRDVLRAFRSGGSADITGDLNNGFLLDEEKPKLIGRLSVVVAGTPVPDPGVVDVYTLPQMVFQVVACASTPKVGDVLTQGQVSAQIIGFESQSGSVVSNVSIQVLAPPGAMIQPGIAQLQTPFDPDQDLPACFVRFSPNASDAPADDVSKGAQMILLFSEPMDPTSLTSFDNYTIRRVAADPTAFDLIVGEVLPSANLREFVFQPRLPLKHGIGQSEEYYLKLEGDEDGPTDLAGNPLLEALPQVAFRLDPTEGTDDNGGVAFRFASPDELYDDEFPELRAGQILYNLGRELIQPRPVNRFPVAADRDKPVPSVMVPFVPGVQTPLSPLGSKLQAVWRYCDLGFSVTDETNINIDVEGVAWAPIGAAVVSDTYDEFQLTLAHSYRLPDEFLNPMSGFPNFPNSGLVTTYVNNYLDPQNDGGKVMAPRDEGYAVNPADLFTAESGTFMMPWPVNTDVPIEQFRYYTWRDTAILGLGGPQGGGAMLFQEVAVLGQGTVGVPWPAGQVPTSGLPLLIEVRCYPDDNGLGLNAFDISLAANSSAKPNFRAFSTGGYDTSNQPVVRDPDLQNEASGGFNPNSNPPGATTLPADNSFYIGQLDLVTRISRFHTIWIDTVFAAPTYASPVIEPNPNDQPAGTQVVLAFRGASLITNTDGGSPRNDITTNAATINIYGNPNGLPTPEPSAPVYLNNDPTWKTKLSDVDGAKAFQVRVTFISNPISNKTAELSALGFAWSN